MKKTAKEMAAAVQVWILTCIVVQLMSIDVSSAQVSFTHGGYNNIVVAISNQVAQPSNCSQFLIDFEASFEEGSGLLHRATDGRAYFRSVSVILPNHWDLTRCSRTVSRTRSDSYDDADVRVANSHPLFGDAPFTLQSRGCAQPGDYIYTSLKFFTSRTSATNQGKRLVREWAKLRYGVFDEMGYPEDPLYPFFYEDNIEVKPTGCSNNRILSGEKTNCDSSDKNCGFVPVGNEDVTSSLMSYPQLPNTIDFCDDSNHNDLAPTKQNLVCEGRSIKEVVFSHEDFINWSEVVNRTSVAFSYRQHSPPRFVLALDRGGAMDERDHWKFLRIACRRLVLQDLPDSTEIAILSFKDTVTYHTDNISILSSLPRREFVASAIPDFLSLPPSISSSQDSCILCAVQEAIMLLERTGTTAAGDAIVIVTSGASNLEQIQSAMNYAKQRRVRVSIVTYAYSGTLSSQRALQNLADSTNGLMATVASRGVGYMSHISMLIQLGDSLLAAVRHHYNSPNLPILVHEQEFDDSTNGWVNGSFVLDANLGRDTVLGIYFYSRDNTHIGDIKVIGPDGVEYRGKGEDAMASLYFTPLATIDKPGVWRYSFDRRSQSHQSHFVKVTSKPKLRSQTQQKGTISASLKILNAESVNPSKPVTFYATVTMGDLPVLDARVRAIIRNVGSLPSNDINEDNAMNLDLLDNGNTEPDITRGDGVYSRYLGRFPRESGVYSVVLSVDAMDGRAYTVRSTSLQEGYDAECCGSVIRVPQERRELTGAFTRMIPAGVFIVNGSDFIALHNSSGSSFDPDSDLIPPSRVTDLSAEVNAPRQRLTFQWTAVGDDYDIGTAYTYDLRISTNRQDLKSSSFDSAESLPVLVLSQPSGTLMQFSTEFQRYDRPFYVAIRAVDRHGNHGRISNTIQIFMPAPPTTTTTSWSSTVSFISDPSFNETSFASQWFNGGLSTVHLAAMVASICVAVIILIVVVYVIVHAKRRKDKEAVKLSYNPPAVNATLYKSEKETPAPIKSDYNNVSAIYDGKNDSVPVHWSASQLLQEHEKRRSPSEQESITYPYDYNISARNHPMQRNSTVYSGSYHINSGSATYSPDDTNVNAYYAADSVTPPSVDFEGSSLDGYSGGGYKTRPPTMPKPDTSRQRSLQPMGNAALQGSFTSLASERKKRNVTQV